MKSFFEITGENGDTPTTSYLFSDSDRYFFDCGEGFQKFIKGRPNITLGKVKSLFITKLSWDCIGGLIGLFLTLAEYNVKIKVYGPKGLHKLFTASREFQYSLNVEIHEIDTDKVQIIKDELFVFYTLPIFKSIINNNNNNNNNINNNDNNEIKESLIDETGLPKFTYYGKRPNFNQEIIENYDEPIVCYIGKTKDFKGKFYPEKAAALGVPKGIAYKHLQDGNSVLNKDGETITPDQVMQPSVKGSKIAVIRCPSIEYLDSLLKHTHMFKDIHVVTHITPQSVLTTDKYIKFMENITNQSSSLSSKTKHIIVNHENCERSSGCLSSDIQISKLRKFIPQLFPINDTQRQQLSIDLKDSKILNNTNIIPCKDATNITLGPPQNAGEIQFLPMFLNNNNNNNNSCSNDGDNVDEDINNSEIMEDFINTKQGQIFKNQLDDQIKHIESDCKKRCFPKILFTGTGSAIPSKYRNVTGNFITLKDGSNLLLDAGESTFGQLYRFFGPIDIKKQLINLKIIWISHLHADHHLGIPNLLEKRQQYSKELNIAIEPLIIIGPNSIVQWIKDLSSIIDMNFVGITIGKETEEFYQICKSLDIKSVTMVPVIHCNFAFGIVIEWNDGFKLTYSGDTRPCKFLSEMGKDSSVQIHEATFEDEKRNDAISKRHSTVGEALEVGRNMNCQFSLLTHFSQRYPNLKMGTYNDTNYGLAIDLLQIAPYQYPLVYRMIEPFSLLFENEAQKKLDRKQQIHQQTLIQQPNKKFKAAKQPDDTDPLEKDAKRLERYQNKYKKVETNLPAYLFNIISKSLSKVENTFDDLNSQPQIDDNDSF
ncbi:hypothetical protein RB653_002851 [Dictyostelium firmibasis]|uniref:ribonuclease Z n=1 Tax=Dictyostelium firmibasis TaxID=79012 RepID=A0AAN7TYA3_9MYCE